VLFRSPSKPFTLTDLATDIIILSEHLGLRQPVLVGHSLGGMVAMVVAQKVLRLGALVLIEGWTNLKTAANAFREPRFFGRLAPLIKIEIQDKSKKTTARFQPEVWDYFWQSVLEFDARDFLESTSLPIYEIYGNLGRIETTRQNLMIPSKPNIEVIWLDDAGHYLPVEKPVELATICQRVLAQCKERQTHE
jgi:pimeloyl-ACP methyl ester carboxylesterase